MLKRLTKTFRTIFSLSIATLLILGGITFSQNNVAEAQVNSSIGVQSPLVRSGGAALLIPSTLTLGSAGSPISTGYFTNLVASSTQTDSISFSSIGGDLDFGGYDLNNGGTITARDFVATSTVADESSPAVAFGDGDTGFFETSDDLLTLSRGGSAQFYLGSGNELIFGTDTNAGAIRNITTTVTTPSLLPASGDLDTGIAGDASNGLSFVTGGSSRMFIDSNGRVGVSTTTPQARLHVGDVSPLSWVFDGATEDGLIVGNTSDVDGRVYIEGSQSAAFVLYDSGGTADERTVSLQINGGTSKFRSYNDSGTQNSMFMEFNHNTDSIFFSPNGDGGVGISTSTTPEKELVVDGAVRATECTLADGATVTFNADNCNQARVTLGGNRTIDFTNWDDSAGQKFLLNLCQDGSGNRTVTWDSSIRWLEGSAPTLSTDGGVCDVFSGYSTAGTSTPYIILGSAGSF